ncbi:MAG: hypothetical protein SFX72_00785 [Isosphaeraceae bacterium]|nr:hypothetical protein [Isosphaeraceae bacterium]
MSTRRKMPNVFYVLLMVVSTAFVFTCFCYLIAPTIVDTAANPRPGGNVPSPGAIAAARWFDDWGTTLLAGQVVAMIVLGSVAMLADPWFSREDQPASDSARPDGPR